VAIAAGILAQVASGEAGFYPTSSELSDLELTKTCLLIRDQLSVRRPVLSVCAAPNRFNRTAFHSLSILLFITRLRWRHRTIPARYRSHRTQHARDILLEGELRS
jgi:hypothetical protein